MRRRASIMLTWFQKNRFPNRVLTNTCCKNQKKGTDGVNTLLRSLSSSRGRVFCKPLQFSASQKSPSRPFSRFPAARTTTGACNCFHRSKNLRRSRYVYNALSHRMLVWGGEYSNVFSRLYSGVRCQGWTYLFHIEFRCELQTYLDMCAKSYFVVWSKICWDTNY